jgi:hypothetical protein
MRSLFTRAECLSQTDGTSPGVFAWYVEFETALMPSDTGVTHVAKHDFIERSGLLRIPNGQVKVIDHAAHTASRIGGGWASVVHTQGFNERAHPWA